MKQNTILMIVLVILLLIVGTAVIINKPADDLEIAPIPSTTPKIRIEEPVVTVVQPAEETGILDSN
jgi:hypothetical protein